MTNYDATDFECPVVQCAVCDAPMSEGSWYARRDAGDLTVAFCCPVCEAAFESNPDGYLRRAEALQTLLSSDASPGC